MINIPIAQLDAEMTRMADTFERGSLAGGLQECAGLINQAVADNFHSSGSPAGPWPPRKDSKPHPLLILSGDMMDAATREGARGHIEEIGDRDATVGIDGNEIVYALAQNFGYPPRNLPARPYMVIEDSVVDACGAVIATHAFNLLGT